MGFKDELAEYCSIMESESEENDGITEEQVLAALLVLNYMDYGKVPDAFLACASMNLLNAYKRQPEPKISYQYKRHLLEIVKGIEDIDQPKAIKIGYDPSANKQLLIVQFWNFQFSFQASRYSSSIDRLITETKTKIGWDGVKKQAHAIGIFNFALNSRWITKTTMFGKPLITFIKEEIDSYHRGEYKFINGKLRKVSGIAVVADDCEDYYLKNYMRIKLLKCTDRPVILSGIFRKAWEKHITFTSVKPYIQGVKTADICDHVNLYRPLVEKYIDINFLERGNRYYIIGFCKMYPHSKRMGVNLPKKATYTPIFPLCNFKLFPKDILAECHRFSIEEFIRADQGKMTL